MKILFAGLGSIGQRHLRNLRTLLGDDCEVIAYRARGRDVVLDGDNQVVHGASIAGMYGVREFDSLDRALADGPDVVFVTNPTRHHVPVAIESARAGCQLFIEKPLSDIGDGVEELAQLVDEKHLIAQVGFQLRYHPVLRAARAIIESGRIGRIIHARLEAGEYLPGWHPYEQYQGTYAAMGALGGGALATQSHEFDYALWLFGMPRRVFAVGGHLTSFDIDVEDVASVLMQCDVDGRTVPVHIQLDYAQLPPVRGGVIVGDQGRVVIDLMVNTVTVFDARHADGELSEFPEFMRNQLFLDELANFLAALRGEADPFPGLDEGVSSLRVIEASRRSLETSEAVAL